MREEKRAPSGGPPWLHMIFEGSTLSTQVSSGPETRTHICSQQQAEVSFYNQNRYCFPIVHVL